MKIFSPRRIWFRRGERIELHTDDGDVCVGAGGRDAGAGHNGCAFLAGVDSNNPARHGFLSHCFMILFLLKLRGLGLRLWESS